MSSRPSGWFSVFALPLNVTPPNLQNHLALGSEGYLSNQCFGSSSRNVAVGGERREKHNPEMSVCNGDSTVAGVDALKRTVQSLPKVKSLPHLYDPVG